MRLPTRQDGVENRDKVYLSMEQWPVLLICGTWPVL